LEYCISKGKDALQFANIKDEKLSNRSGISRMSGATDFDKFEDKSKKVKTQH
jgi:hypothetical protein